MKQLRRLRWPKTKEIWYSKSGYSFFLTAIATSICIAVGIFFLFKNVLHYELFFGGQKLSFSMFYFWNLFCGVLTSLVFGIIGVLFTEDSKNYTMMTYVWFVFPLGLFGSSLAFILLIALGA